MNQKSNIKKDYFWNTIGSGIYALASMVLAFVVMHIAGPDDGGIFSFGFSAFGQQMFIISYFGIRPFHITDASYEYSYEEYRKLRVLTSAGAVLIALLYLVLMQLLGFYSFRKAAIIILLAVYKVADGIADLYESECQRAGLLWLGGKELSIRTALASGSIIMVMLIAGDVVAACILAAAVQMLCIVFFRAYMAKNVLSPANGETEGKHKGVSSLARSTVLLFLSVFVDFYIFSASKYAIDMYLTDADSGIFNILFMPTSVIYLAANFIIKPYMTRLSAFYEKNDMESFRAVVGRLRLAVLLMSALAMAGTILLGKPVLMVLELLLGKQYSGMLTSRTFLFILIILGGCFYALTNLYYYILVILRRQKRIFINYLVMAAAAAVISNIAVLRFGLTGAAAAYTICMGLITILFAASCELGDKLQKQL